MDQFGVKRALLGLACVAGLSNWHEADAQGTAAATAPSGATAPVGVQMVPVPVPLFTPSVSGGAGDSGAGMGGVGGSSNIFNNPYAAPLLYSSMLPNSQAQALTGSSTATTTGVAPGMTTGISPAQWGLLMLTTQKPMGIGSGRLSGARSGSNGGAGQAGPQTASQQSNARSIETRARPGGLAARYFNRTTPRSPYPQSYFNRPSRYFP
jgi:hypothetical protein